MADVFSRDVSYGGAFSADGAKMTFAGFAAGLLIQQVQWQYQQNISRLYEVGSADVYLVAGRTQGQVSLSRVLGPMAIMPTFYTQYGNVCNAAGNLLSFSGQAGCGGVASGTPMTIGINHVVIQQLGGSVQSADMVINETLAMMFLFMTIS